MTTAMRSSCAISIHALREEGDSYHDGDEGEKKYFYPRPPRGGRQGHTEVHRMTLEISIHALREEGDAFAGLFIFAPKLFLSTPSARRATQK